MFRKLFTLSLIFVFAGLIFAVDIDEALPHYKIPGTPVSFSNGATFVPIAAFHPDMNSAVPASQVFNDPPEFSDPDCDGSEVWLPIVVEVAPEPGFGHLGNMHFYGAIQDPKSAMQSKKAVVDAFAEIGADVKEYFDWGCFLFDKAGNLWFIFQSNNDLMAAPVPEYALLSR